MPRLSRTPEENEHLIGLYTSAQQTIGEIAASYGVSGHTINKRLKALGVPLRSRGGRKGRPQKRISQKRIDLDLGQILQMWREERQSVPQIAKKLYVSPQTIRQRLKEHGVYYRAKR